MIFCNLFVKSHGFNCLHDHVCFTFSIGYISLRSSICTRCQPSSQWRLCSWWWCPVYGVDDTAGMVLSLHNWGSHHAALCYFGEGKGQDQIWRAQGHLMNDGNFTLRWKWKLPLQKRKLSFSNFQLFCFVLGNLQPCQSSTIIPFSGPHPWKKW